MQVLLSFILSLSFAGAGVPDLLSQIEDFRKSFLGKTLQVATDKKVRLLLLGTEKTYVGQFYKKDKRFLWDLSGQSKQKLIFDGEKLVSLTENEDRGKKTTQAIVFSSQGTDAVEKNALYLVFQSKKSLKEIFEVSQIDERTLKLVDKSKTLPDLRVFFDKGRITEIRFTEDEVSETTVLFSDYKIAQSLSDQFFKIAIPKDADVLQK